MRSETSTLKPVVSRKHHPALKEGKGGKNKAWPCKRRHFHNSAPDDKEAARTFGAAACQLERGPKDRFAKDGIIVTLARNTRSRRLIR
jgi:hypothetical protein